MKKFIVTALVTLAPLAASVSAFGEESGTPSESLPAIESLAPTDMQEEFSDMEDSGGNQFAVVCLINDTGITVNFQYKWGNGSYRSKSISSGRRHWFSQKYRVGSRSSDTFHIKFDYDLRRGRDTKKYYTLNRYQAQFQDCDSGKKYRFSRSGDFIDLYSI